MNLARAVLLLLLGRRLPTTSGRIELAEIGRDVVIHRDRWGIPHIEAASDEDAWLALGFCHGQDRGFQLELLLRIVRGTMAALVGRDGLAIDRLSRRMGLRRSAEAQRAVLDVDIRAIADAYARGVNAGRTRGARALPHELALLRARPTPLDGSDVLGVAALQGMLLGPWDDELVRLEVVTKDGPEALAALDGGYPEWLPVTFPPGAKAAKAVAGLQAELRAPGAVVGAGGASNNWAVAASRTATGRPILANDMHLAPVHPPHWYLAHVRAPEWEVAGASMVGLPAILAGHNDVAAWGLTATWGADNADLAIEKIGPDGRSVRRGDAHVPCEVRREVIEVRGAEPVVEEVLITPHGPIIGPALEGDVGAVSIRATWLQPRRLRAAFGFPRARSFAALRQACRYWPTAGQNVVYADTAGAIGWQLTGDLPRRKKGHGALPMVAADLEAGWDGDVPFEQLPHAVDPPNGWIATANNAPQVDGEEPFLGRDWVDGYRLAAIGEALDARSDWDVSSTQALQMDATSLPWRELRETVLAVPIRDPDAAEARRTLEAWDGRVTIDSAGASVYELFVLEMRARVVRAKAPNSAEWLMGRGFSAITPTNVFWRTSHLVRLVREQPRGFFERGWSAEIEEALGAVVRRLRARGDAARWGWGHVRPLTLRHALRSRRPLDRIFDVGPIPWGGDGQTISMADWTADGDTATIDYIASVRLVMDVGDWGASRFSLPGGQSGNPLSPHYEDLLEHWTRGTGVPIAWTHDEVRAARVETLELVPVRRAS